LLNPEHPKFEDVFWDGGDAITLDDRLWAT
jgi:hypothetical protein